MTKIRIQPTKRKIFIQEVDQRFFPEAPVKDIDNHYWFLLKVNNQTAGYCGVKVLPNQVAELTRAGIFESYQGFGYQKKMIKARERFAHRLGCTMVKTYCSVDNVQSANSLISCGYKLYIPEVYDDGDYHDWMCWRKRLK